MNGTLGILNVGAGDTKLTFDKSNPEERIRASRIVKDMLRRGYALLIEVDEGGEKVTRRALDFDDTVCEYIIADFDPVAAADADQQEIHDGQGSAIEASPPASDGKKKRGPKPGSKRLRRVPADSTTGVAVARTAGG